jgi:hypothetical protein
MVIGSLLNSLAYSILVPEFVDKKDRSESSGTFTKQVAQLDSAVLLVIAYTGANRSSFLITREK